MDSPDYTAIKRALDKCQGAPDRVAAARDALQKMEQRIAQDTSEVGLLRLGRAEKSSADRVKDSPDAAAIEEVLDTGQCPPDRVAAARDALQKMKERIVKDTSELASLRRDREAQEPLIHTTEGKDTRDPKVVGVPPSNPMQKDGESAGTDPPKIIPPGGLPQTLSSGPQDGKPISQHTDALSVNGQNSSKPEGTHHLDYAVLVSGLALLLSLVALGAGIKLRSSVNGWQKSEQKEQAELTSALSDLNTRLERASSSQEEVRVGSSSLSPAGKSPKKPQQSSRADTEKRGVDAVRDKAADLSRTISESTRGAGEPTRADTSTWNQAASQAQEATAPPIPQPEPLVQRSTGDPFRDYSYAKTLGDEAGEDWFQENYRTQGLSCVNLNDHRMGTTALYFKPDARGKFMMVDQDERAQVLPAFGLDFVSGRSSLEGVFLYPAAIVGTLILAQPATVHRTGDSWTLKQPGEFRCG